MVNGPTAKAPKHEYAPAPLLDRCFATACSECASGFVKTKGGECEAARSHCTGGNAVRAVIFVTLAVLVLCFTLVRTVILMSLAVSILC